MTQDNRKQALKRLLIGVPYMILYVLVLFPVVLVVGIVLGAVDVLWRLVFNTSGSALSRVVGPLWDWIGGNARWTLTGSGTFRLIPSY